jgi:hypothetical protein
MCGAPVARRVRREGELAAAGAVSRPVFEYCSVCGVPTSVPSIDMLRGPLVGVAVFTKYMVPVCVAPSESNSVSDVAWLKEFGSLGRTRQRRRSRWPAG